MMRAAVAIGSNSTRMLAAEKRDGVLRVAARGREETRLFLGLDENGRIRPERVESTAQAVMRLVLQARLCGAREITVFATSAMRDAGNSDALAERVRQLCGLPLRVISGQEEARLAFAAASEGKRRLVMDIGGGSTEWTLGENGQVEWAVSMQLGASRLLKAQPIGNRDQALEALEAARRVMAPYGALYRTLPPASSMAGMGGTCTTAASIRLGREVHGEAANGYTVSLEEAKRQLFLLSPLSLQERAGVPGLPPGRAAHMPHGLCILIAALEICGFPELIVSGRTNLDGYLLSLPE